jgi:hypothetical protein
VHIAHNAPSWHTVQSVHYLPTRAPIREFNIVVKGHSTRQQELRVQWSYESVVAIGDERFSGEAWTRVEFRLPVAFAGGEDQFAAWCAGSNGIRKLVDETLRFQNLLLEHMKDEQANNSRLVNLRHFGPAEWPFLQYTIGDLVIFSRANPCLLSSLASRPITLDLSQFRSGLDVPTPRSAIIRAASLVDSGYPTEALLTAFAILDAMVQRVLKQAMAQSGISEDAASALLRNTTQSRLATYLDPVLKLVSGHSMKDDEKATYEAVLRINGQRNDAIHRGEGVSRSDARDACRLVFDTLEYLDRVTAHVGALGDRPEFVEP